METNSIFQFWHWLNLRIGSNATRAIPGWSRNKINLLWSHTMRIQALFQTLFFYCVRESQKKGTMQCIEQVKDCCTERCWRLGLSYTATKEILCRFAMDFWFLCHEVHIPGMWKDMDISCGHMHNVRVLGEMGKSTAGTNLELSDCMCVAMRL